MKRIKGITLIVVLGLGMLGAGYLYQTQEVPYVAPRVETVEVEKEVDPLAVAIERAVAASSTDIQKAAEEAAEATRKRLETEIELRVRKEHKEALDGKIDELEKEIGVY